MYSSKDGLILIPFRLPQVSYFTPCLKCFSSDSGSCLDVKIGPLLQFLHPLRAGPVLLTLLFFPLVPWSYWVLHGSMFPFPLVRYSCPLSAGILHALLCLKVYSWCIHGERCAPCPPTPPPSCSLHWFIFVILFSEKTSPLCSIAFFHCKGRLCAFWYYTGKEDFICIIYKF